MQSLPSEKENELKFALEMYKLFYLPGPLKCKCGNIIFSIQTDSYNATSGCCVICSNYKCRLKYYIRKNSIFSLFPYIKMKVIYEIINCFINLDFNAVRACSYLKETKNITIENSTLLKIYNKLRDVLYKYLFILYDSEPVGQLNKVEYFSVDEGLITH